MAAGNHPLDPFIARTNDLSLEQREDRVFIKTAFHELLPADMRFQEGSQRRQQHLLAELSDLASGEDCIFVDLFLAVRRGVDAGLNP